MPKARPMYSNEFKAEAVKLVKESGKPILQISRDLGVSVKSLKRWVKHQEIDSGTPKALPLLKRCELRKLACLKTASFELNGRYKKGAHLFAHETDENSSHIFVHRGREGGLTLLPNSFAFWSIGQRIL